MVSKEFKKKLIRALRYLYREITYSDIENYDLTDDNIDGHRSKEFVRVNGSLFNELITELNTNPNSSYITYVNKLLKEGYIPKKLSCLRKTINNGKTNPREMIDADIIFKETMASRILNLYECPTVFNITIKDPEKSHHCAFSTLSVDAISGELKTLEDIDCEFGSDLEKSVQSLKQHLITFPICIEQENLLYKNMDKIVKDYVYSFAIRKLVLDDIDFYENNCGILIDEHTIKYINFDYENTFSNSYNFTNPSKTLKYMQDNFPDVFKKFEKKSDMIFHTLVDASKLREIEYMDDNHHENISRFIINLRSTLTTCQHLDKSYKLNKRDAIM